MKRRIAFVLIMGFITTGLISFTLVSINVGYISTFFKIWMRSWLIAYAIAIPTFLFLGPKVEKLVEKLFDEQK